MATVSAPPTPAASRAFRASRALSGWVLTAVAAVCRCKLFAVVGGGRHPGAAARFSVCRRCRSALCGLDEPASGYGLCLHLNIFLQPFSCPLRLARPPDCIRPSSAPVKHHRPACSITSPSHCLVYPASSRRQQLSSLQGLASSCSSGGGDCSPPGGADSVATTVGRQIRCRQARPTSLNARALRELLPCPCR